MPVCKYRIHYVFLFVSVLKRQLDGSNNVNELMRMPEILVLGPNVEMLMYCKTCMELQRVVEERKLKLTFVKNRGKPDNEFFKIVVTPRPSREAHE